ncbi:hypothetical protein BVG16_27080 [Paenibacillus selenitireducens]|uniref:DUF2785 domain-containing protein n=2 Tax=Paenibacillus selenitireducens TaxID=1324314 RepID=A0A1T2X1S8_9BACL|nr:hypothetical protein BVG16_27080 [Paenibacillus selenitireducens]
MVMKELLLRIEQEDYRVPSDMLAYELALKMMEDIGDVDSEYRDNLIYSTLYMWSKNQEFTADQMRHLLRLSLDDNHSFLNMGEMNTDSVFTRAFSVLFVPLAISYHEHSNFLTEQEISEIKDKLISFFDMEKDLRGYVPGKGWAHAIAHASDALAAVSSLPSIHREDLMEILHVMKRKIAVDRYAFIHSEDERMVNVVMKIFHRGLISDEEMGDWIHEIGSYAKTGHLPEDDILFGNKKRFLRSLYFRLMDQTTYEKYTSVIKEALAGLERSRFQHMV